jgi:hypothetical protein
MVKEALGERLRDETEARKNLEVDGDWKPDQR